MGGVLCVRSEVLFAGGYWREQGRGVLYSVGAHYTSWGGSKENATLHEGLSLLVCCIPKEGRCPPLSPLALGVFCRYPGLLVLFKMKRRASKAAVPSL